jgi:diaphanous 1
MLSRIKLDLSDLRNALLDIDDNKLPVDDLKAIARQLPTPEEVAPI